MFNFAYNIHIIRHPGGSINDSCWMHYWSSFPDSKLIAANQPFNDKQRISHQLVKRQKPLDNSDLKMRAVQKNHVPYILLVPAVLSTRN
jgi:hypothetical protein